MKKVLVVEDNQTNMYLMRFILQKAGHEIIEAWTGAEGVELAEKHHPDLILMDMQLPVLDGFEATKKIRESEFGKTVPIIAITSYAMVGDKERTLKAGCTAYIEKPINPESFIQELKKYL